MIGSTALADSLLAVSYERLWYERLRGTMAMYADKWAGLGDDVIGGLRLLLFMCEFRHRDAEDCDFDAHLSDAISNCANLRSLSPAKEMSET